MTFAYDPGGRQTTAVTSGPSGQQPLVTLTYGFDNVGNRTSMTDSLTNVGRTTYAYDAANRLTTLTKSTGATNGPQVLFSYDAANRVTSISRTINGSGTPYVATYTYDNANRVSGITYRYGNGRLADLLVQYGYTYDAAGRLTVEGTTADGNYFYGYDANNELTTVTATRAETYTYDATGNRTLTGYTTGTGNRLTNTTGVTYTYDAEGNLVNKNGTGGNVTYTYGFRNRLTGVTLNGTLVATYTYDALDRRIGFNISGTQTWTVYDRQNTYADFKRGAVTQTYLYGPAVDELLARTNASGSTTSWYLTDKKGSIRDVFDNIENNLDHVVYDSFGQWSPRPTPPTVTGSSTPPCSTTARRSRSTTTAPARTIPPSAASSRKTRWGWPPVMSTSIATWAMGRRISSIPAD